MLNMYNLFTLRNGVNLHCQSNRLPQRTLEVFAKKWGITESFGSILKQLPENITMDIHLNSANTWPLRYVNVGQVAKGNLVFKLDIYRKKVSSFITLDYFYASLLFVFDDLSEIELIRLIEIPMYKLQIPMLFQKFENSLYSVSKI